MEEVKGKLGKREIFLDFFVFTYTSFVIQGKYFLLK